MLSFLIAGCGSSGVDTSNDKGPTPGIPSNLPTATAAPVATGPTSAQFAAVLLNVADVNKLGIGTFTASAVDAAGSTPSGCAAIDVFAAASKAAKTKAGISFDDAKSQLSAEEDITQFPNASDTLFGALKDGLSSCSTVTADGTRLALQELDDPEVDGSDDTLAAQATATVAGRTITVNIEMARFDENVLSVTFGGLQTTSEATAGMNALFSAALSKSMAVVTS